MGKWFGWFLAGLLVCMAQGALADTIIKTDHTEASLISDSRTIVPGADFHIALKMKLQSHWHTYWLNPGDAGLPTQIQWDVPTGIEMGQIQWPIPHAISLGDLMNYGYADTTIYPIPVHVAKDFTATGPVTIKGHASWLVCESVCIPEDGDVSLVLDFAPAGSAPERNAKAAKTIDAAIAALPKSAPSTELQAAFSFSDDMAKFSFAGPLAQKLAASGEPLYFFPLDSGAVSHPAPQKVSTGTDGFTIWAKPGFRAKRGELKKPGGMLVMGSGKDRQAWNVDLLQTGAALPQTGANTKPIAAPVKAPAKGGLLQALLFAFLGGLVLNLMPCVFPVLSIKVLGFVNAAHEEQSAHRTQGILFGAGVLLSFLVLAGLLIALKAGGAQIGWGFQLQNTWFVADMVALFFLIGLNLVGLFEIGGSWTATGSSLTQKQGGMGAFFTGVLAVLVASPCTAPAMGAALGYTLGQGTWVTLLVFGALGVGFALPFVLLSFFPAWLSALPKPGPWMERFHQFLAFPMFAAALWLVWVLGGLGGMIAAAFALLACLMLAFAIWAWKGRMIGKVLAVIGFAGFAWAFAHAAANAPETTLEPQAWSPEKVAQLQGENRKIFVDFTADWCLTCQVNKKTSLQSKAVAQAFAKNNVAYLEADWTKRDARIAQELAKRGRAGVPMYLVYLPGQSEPVVLPQLLTPQIVVDAVNPAKP